MARPTKFNPDRGRVIVAALLDGQPGGRRPRRRGSGCGPWRRGSPRAGRATRR